MLMPPYRNFILVEIVKGVNRDYIISSLYNTIIFVNIYTESPHAEKTLNNQHLKPTLITSRGSIRPFWDDPPYPHLQTAVHPSQLLLRAGALPVTLRKPTLNQWFALSFVLKFRDCGSAVEPGVGRSCGRL